MFPICSVWQRGTCWASRLREAQGRDCLGCRAPGGFGPPAVHAPSPAQHLSEALAAPQDCPQAPGSAQTACTQERYGLKSEENGQSALMHKQPFRISKVRSKILWQN